MNNISFTCEAFESERGETIFRVKMLDGSGEIVQRELELSSFVHLLDATKVMDVNYIHIEKDLIPDGYIDGYFASKVTFSCVWEVKGAKRQFVLDMRLKDNPLRHHVIPYPDLVFALTVRDGKKRSFKIFAKKEGEDRLYNYPFGNVNINGNVCMGNIVSDCIKPADIEEDFFLGVTNNDYYNSSKKCGKDWSQEKLIKELEGMDKYPDEWLVDAGMDLSQLVDKCSVGNKEQNMEEF